MDQLGLIFYSVYYTTFLKYHVYVPLYFVAEVQRARLCTINIENETETFIIPNIQCRIPGGYSHIWPNRDVPP